MIIYESTKGEFMEHVTDDTIVECIHKKYIEKMGKNTSKREIESWNNSLMYMYKVLNTKDIPNNCGVAIEYKIPATSRRIDFLLTGLDENDKSNIIVIELKQWQKVEVVQGKEALVRTALGGGIRETSMVLLFINRRL